MIGRVSFEPKNAYLSFSGSGLSSSLGGEMGEGMGGVPEVIGKGSFGALHGGKSMAAAVSSKELTSLI